MVSSFGSLLNIKCNQYDVLVNTEKTFCLSNELKNVVFNSIVVLHVL